MIIQGKSWRKLRAPGIPDAASSAVLVGGPDNPYWSPSAGADGQGQLKVWREGEGISSHLVASGLLFRRVIIEAPLDLTVEFNGLGLRDVIRVDGQIAASRISWWRITPRFDFQLITTADESIPIAVDIGISPMLRMRDFRIRIGDYLVYEESKTTGSDRI